MKQEHKFCAEVYHRLYGQIDHSKRVLFCLDGGAAKESCKAAAGSLAADASALNLVLGIPNIKGDGLECDTVPDLCFFFTGADIETRIEAKVLENNSRIIVQPVQREKWKFGGNGKLPPQLWMIADEPLEKFWLLEHGVVAELLRVKEGANRVVNLWPNVGPPMALLTWDILTAQIVAWAEAHRRKPT